MHGHREILRLALSILICQLKKIAEDTGLTVEEINKIEASLSEKNDEDN